MTDRELADRYVEAFVKFIKTDPGAEEYDDLKIAVHVYKCEIADRFVAEHATKKKGLRVKK